MWETTVCLSLFLPGYLSCHRRKKQNIRKNQVTIMYINYSHWLSINSIIQPSYEMVPDLPCTVHVFELFPMHATLQETFTGHYEACSSKAGVFNLHCSCLRTLCSKGQNVNQMKTAVVFEADAWGAHHAALLLLWGLWRTLLCNNLNFFIKTKLRTIIVFFERRISKWRGTTDWTALSLLSLVSHLS